MIPSIRSTCCCLCTDIVAPDNSSGCFSTTSLSKRETRGERRKEGKGREPTKKESVPPSRPEETVNHEPGILTIN